MSATEVIPGSPPALHELSAALLSFGLVASGAAQRLDVLGSQIWIGEAADAFAEVVSDIPAKLGDAATAFGEASAAVSVYAGVLSASQAEVARAIDLHRVGKAQTDQWSAAWNVYRASVGQADGTDGPGDSWVPARPSGSDPGNWERSEAERMITTARQRVQDAAIRAKDRMHEAWRLAPDKPGFWSRAGHSIGQFGLGVWDSVYGMGEFIVSVSPVRMLIDPEGWSEDMLALGQGIVYGVTHPVEFAKALTNWEMWLDNPARALGQLVPDVVLALATAGGGTAATAARRGVDTADTLSDLGLTASRLENLEDATNAGTRLDELSDMRRIVDDVATDAVDLGAITPSPVWRQDTNPVWRADGRPMNDIFTTGFRPRDATNMNLEDFVLNNTPSGFVSTSRDPSPYQQWGSRYRYEIAHQVGSM